jgi:hypothetical protein
MAQAGAVKVAAFLAAVAADVSTHPAVVQPLWAHVAQDASTLLVLEAWATEHDAKKNPEEDALSPFVRTAGMPLSALQVEAMPVPAKLGAAPADDENEYFVTHFITVVGTKSGACVNGELRRLRSKAGSAPAPAPEGRVFQSAVAVFFYEGRKKLTGDDEEEATAEDTKKEE